MSTNHNRIKVADLEKSELNRTLITNENGELEFKDINEIKIDSYNALDYTLTGKALDARQGKVLKDLVDDINELLISDNIDLNNIQKLGDAIETVQISLNTILVNDLTTGGTTKALSAEMGKLLQTNKVDKIAGERLINAAEITKLSGFSNVTTTLKTILSTVLPTQNLAGFVSYINALNPVLIVGPNEIVKFTTSDTGRTFELNLRGRSFGVGQPAIVESDVMEVTAFLNKDIRLNNYSSSRNDGVNPTNKVLGTDANGNLKLYTIAMTPAPYLYELFPQNRLPSTTGNFILKGSFFTPTMTVAITGQTVNYITFISDNEVHVNVTTGNVEGNFDINLNNGISSTYAGALLIILGTVYKPKASDWTNLEEPINISDDGELKVAQYTLQGSAILDKNKISIKPSINYRFVFNYENTPFEQVPSVTDFSSTVTFYRVSDNVPVYSLSIYLAGGLFLNNLPNHYAALKIKSGENLITEIGRDISGNVTKSWNGELRLQRVNGIVSLFYGGGLMTTFTHNEMTEMYVKFQTKKVDFLNIKYIETI